MDSSAREGQREDVVHFRNDADLSSTAQEAKLAKAPATQFWGKDQLFSETKHWLLHISSPSHNNP